MSTPRPGVFEFDMAHSNRPLGRYLAEAVIGITPLIQYLVPFPGGRLQTMDPAYDPRSNEWFYVYGDEDRQPHEWGAWMNRGMNWNSQCAFCHMTAFEKRYDAASDTYASTWRAMGISCSQCHPLTPQPSSNGCPAEVRLSTNLYVQTCATCHARREQMTERFTPGDSFDDHFRITLADERRIFHPDGQVADEDYEYASFMMSRMGHKGVYCLDCHDPHSGKLKYAWEGNVVCLQCHIPPGIRGATAIDPVQHSFHSLTNNGSLCVECHMPHNTYMARDPRRDHGMTSPDPLLTKELGIHNVCNRCHVTNTVDWSIGWVDKWYGTNMERRVRERARVIARAQNGDATVLSNLLAMTRSEEIAAWRAALVALLQPWADRQEVSAILRDSLTNESPWVRSAAIRGLARLPGSYNVLSPMRADSSRLVRVDAAFATLNTLERDVASYRDLQEYLGFVSDQPAGALRNAQRALAEGRADDAERWARKAADWDQSAGSRQLLSQFLHAAGKATEAIAAAQQACDLDPASADNAYTLALLCAEAGRVQEALDALQKTVKLDPQFGRAWYNLGLAHAQLEQLSEAATALARAGELMPDSADPPYALATVCLRMNDPARARTAADQALATRPDHAEARILRARLDAQD
jgi:predicted CXXCH cytochrome family protein